MTRSSVRLRPSGSRIGGAAGAFAVALLILISSGVVDTGAKSHALGSDSNSRGGTVSASMLPSVPTPKSNHYDWPEFHQGAALNGYAGNSPLSTLNASSLGVAWATNLYGAVLDSPAVAYNPILRETLVYIGTDSGNFVAVNLANGQIVWGDWLGSPIRSSPLVVNGSVFVVPFSNAMMLKLNDTTGTSICSTALPGATEATPTYGAPPGGVPSVYLGTEAPSPHNGPFMAINAQTCSIEWEFSGYNVSAGSWSPASYVINASGGPMVLFGTDDPDSSVYALNALTGHLIWRFQCYDPPGKDYDVGAGPSVGRPGANGFPQGVVYITNSADIAYALDLNNGTLIWETNFLTLSGLPLTVEPRARSTPALDGKYVIFGYNEGLINLNARSGKLLWIANDSTGTESIAAPAIAGSTGRSIVITGDVGGNLDVLSSAGGARLYTYPTGGWIASSPAVSDRSVVIASSDGFLYDFSLHGGNDGTLPATSISSPPDEATMANPNGTLTVYGNATDPMGIATVAVAIQSGDASGPWWDATTKSWSPGPIDNPATLGSPGAGSTSWSLSFPIPSAGGTYSVIANAQSISGQSDLNGAAVDFVVNYSTSGPYLRASSEYVAPGGSLTVSGGGFAPLSKVRINLSGKTLAKMTAGSDWSLPSTLVVIPNASTFGPTSLTAAGSGPGQSTSTSITVANSWDQLGYSPGHSGFEPNDPTLRKVIFPGNDYWLKVAWRFTAPAPLNSSPAVVDGRAYVGDTVGNLFAIDLSNGGLLWNSTLSSGAAIDGSPAVDPNLGRVFVGADDGSLYSFDLSNGTLAWTVALGGDVSAPVLSNRVLYLTSSVGAVASIAESTGAVLWSSTLGSVATAPPALNETAHLLVVGESNGAVVALNETTGAVRWSSATGGPVTAAPLLTRGTVYVGSNDHRLYAFNQTTGKLRWSFLTGGGRSHSDPRQLELALCRVG